MIPNLVVFAYSAVGHACLEFLLSLHHAGQLQIQGVFTHSDQLGETIWFGSVAELARSSQIPVFVRDQRLAAEDLVLLQNLKPDFLFSFYFRFVLKEEILKTAQKGAFNMHGSLLPKYRGCAPVNWAILFGEKETGVTLHHMVAKVDQGDVVDQEAVAISPTNTAGEVMQSLTEAAVRVLQRQWEPLKEGRAAGIPQDLSKGHYCRRRTPKDGEIVWTSSPWQIHNLIRALLPYPQYPGAWGRLKKHSFLVLANKLPEETSLPEPRQPGVILSADNREGNLELKVACGATGEKVLHLTKIQPAVEGQASVLYGEWLLNPSALVGECWEFEEEDLCP